MMLCAPTAPDHDVVCRVIVIGRGSILPTEMVAVVCVLIQSTLALTAPGDTVWAPSPSLIVWILLAGHW